MRTLLILLVLALAIPSCKKCYQCVCQGPATFYGDSCNKEDVDAFLLQQDTLCECFIRKYQ